MGPLALDAAGHYTRREVLGFDGEREQAVGTLALAGAELAAVYGSGPLTLRASHAWHGLLSWTLTDASHADVSYADYALEPLTSTGRALNNAPDQSTRLAAGARLWGRLDLHVGVRAFWGYQGSFDGLSAVKRAGGGAPVAAARDAGAHGVQLAAGLGARLRMGPARIAVLLHDIPLGDAPKRYLYDRGHTTTTPDQTAWVEEPFATTVRLALDL